MAKKKKLKNVVISNEELTPTVLGYLEENNFSPFFLLIIFGIFFAFLFFVPEISMYIEKLRGNDVSNYIPTKFDDNNTESNQNDIGKEFLFTGETSIIINEITFSNFTLENDTFSFKGFNNSSKKVDFSQNNYYIYLKDSDGNVNDMIKLDDLIISANSEKTYSFKIKNININKIFIDTFKEEYISEVGLSNENIAELNGNI